jgi:hypothetical protein
MTKIAGSGSASGSISTRHGSADPDPDPPPKCHGSATLMGRIMYSNTQYFGTVPYLVLFKDKPAIFAPNSPRYRILRAVMGIATDFFGCGMIFLYVRYRTYC